MYRPDQDAFRGKMGHVAQDAEDVHVHRCGACITGGRQPVTRELSDRRVARETKYVHSLVLIGWHQPKAPAWSLASSC